MEFTKTYYTVEGAADFLKRTADDIIQAAATGVFTVQAKLEQSGLFLCEKFLDVRNLSRIGVIEESHSDFWGIHFPGRIVTISKEELFKFFPGHDEAEIYRFEDVIPLGEPSLYGLGVSVKSRTTPYQIHPVLIKRGRLFIPAEEVKRLKEGHGHPAGPKKIKPSIPNKGGRIKGPFREAMEYAFDKFYNEGNLAILERDNPRAFIDQIKKVMEKEKRDGNIEQYLSDRIKEIKTKAGVPTITTAEHTPERSKYKGVLMPAWDYPITKVSKMLNKLRDDKEM